MSNRNKVSLLSDKLSLNNSIGIALIETWLSEDISDAEIQIENFDIFKTDRVNCARGGAALYLRSDLNC